MMRVSKTAAEARRWRILLLESNTDGTIGGSQRVLLELVRHIDRDRFDPVVVFYQRHALVPDFEALAPVVFFRSGSFRLAVRYPGLYKRLSKVPPALAAVLFVQKIVNFVCFVVPEFARIVALLWRERVDLVCLNNAPVLTQWLLASKLLGRPCVSFFRGTPSTLFTLHRRCMGSYDRVLSISQAVTDNARRCGADVRRFTLIYDGIDADAVRRQVTRKRAEVLREFVADPALPVIGVVNNLKAWKGQHVAVQAMALLHARRPDVVCLLIGDVADGDRPYAEELKAMIREGGLENHVLLTGRRMDVPDLLAGLDIVIHTSLLGEGFPRVILEAMVLGRPLIVSDSGPNREMIEDGVSGYVVPAEDPAALADCIERVLGDREGRIAAGERARERADRLFNIGINMRKTEHAFASLLGGSR